MAKLLTGIKPEDLITLGSSYSRVSSAPLDSTEIHFSLSAAKQYAQTNAYAYVGQKIVVVENGKVTHYSIENVAGDLKELGGGSIEGALIYKGVATGTPDATQTEIPTASGNIKAEGHAGWVYFYNHTEYASNGTIWEPLGYDINTDQLLTKTDASNTYLKKADASSTYLTKTDASSTYATAEYVGKDSDQDKTDWTDNEEGDHHGKVFTLAERINKLKNKFDNYYTKTELFTVENNRVVGVADLFKSAVQMSTAPIVWENISGEAVTPTSLPTEL